MFSLIASLLLKRTSKRECQTCSADGVDYRLGTPRDAIICGPPTVSIGDVIPRSLRILPSVRWTGSSRKNQQQISVSSMFGRPLIHVSFLAAGTAGALSTSLSVPYPHSHPAQIHIYLLTLRNVAAFFIKCGDARFTILPC